MAVPSMPYSDSSVEIIESLTREVEHLRLVLSRAWSANSFPDAAARQSSDVDSLQAAG